MDESTSGLHAGTYVDADLSTLAVSLESQLVELRRTYCRDLVAEGRLDWHGFETGLGEPAAEAVQMTRYAAAFDPSREVTTPQRRRWWAHRSRNAG